MATRKAFMGLLKALYVLALGGIAAVVLAFMLVSVANAASSSGSPATTAATAATAASPAAPAPTAPTAPNQPKAAGGAAPAKRGKRGKSPAKLPAPTAPTAPQQSPLAALAAVTGGAAASPKSGAIAAAHTAYYGLWAVVVAAAGGLGQPCPVSGGTGGLVCAYNSPLNLWLRNGATFALRKWLIGKGGITASTSSQYLGTCSSSGVLTAGGLQAAQKGKAGKVPNAQLVAPQLPACYGQLVTYHCPKRNIPMVVASLGSKPTGGFAVPLPPNACLPANTVGQPYQP